MSENTGANLLKFGEGLQLVLASLTSRYPLGTMRSPPPLENDENPSFLWGVSGKGIISTNRNKTTVKGMGRWEHWMIGNILHWGSNCCCGLGEAV